MIELILRFLTPVICGYLVFVALSNRFIPWSKPASLQMRPRWLFGCCCGAAVTFCMMVLIHFSFGKSTKELVVLAPPLGIVFLTLIAGSAMVWLGYRKRCATLEANSSAAFAESAEDEPLDNSMATEYWAGESDAEYNGTGAHELPLTAKSEVVIENPHNNQHTDSAPPETRPLGKADRDFLKQARKLAKQQYDLRCEVEKNLRVTRKALVKLEAERYRKDAEKSDKQLQLENELQEQIRRTSKVENKLLHEADRMSQLEARLAESKDLVVQAKAELRTNMEARSHAILTARKSVNFARRSMETRDRAKTKLDNLKIQLDIQSQTTSKVIKALELEKQKNRDLNAKILSLQGEQELAGLRKIQRSKPASKPWLSRMTKDKAGTSRIVRKVAEHEADEPTPGKTGASAKITTGGVSKIDQGMAVNSQGSARKRQNKKGKASTVAAKIRKSGILDKSRNTEEAGVSEA